MVLADTETGIPNSLGLSAYAQIGYRNNGTDLSGATGYHVFAQWTKGCFPESCGAGNSPYETNVDPAPTGAENYQIYAEASSGHMVMKHGSTQLGETGYQLSNKWKSSYEVTFSGETKHADTDMPGTTSNSVKFYQLQRFNSDGSITFISDSALSKLPNTSYACGSGCRYGYDRYITDANHPALKVWSP